MALYWLGVTLIVSFLGFLGFLFLWSDGCGGRVLDALASTMLVF
jgi:hypothetical protein